MGRKPKCKYCNKEIEKEDLLKIEILNSKGNKKIIRLHKKCEKEYDELQNFKQNEIEWWNKLYEYIKTLLNYTNEQQLPSYLITRLQDLRNGVTMKRGVGREIKSKEGYKYEIILDCFLEQTSSIEWCFRNKNFKNDKSKINYMMAIIDSNINDNYESYKQRQNINKINDKNFIKEEIEIANYKTINKPIKNNKKRNLSVFLEEDEL